MTFQGRNIKKHFKQSSPSVAEKAQNLEEDDEESEEDSSSESEGENSEDSSGESSDDCEDG